MMTPIGIVQKRNKRGLTNPLFRDIILTESEVTIMDCLKCPNYWKTDIDEMMCACCHIEAPKWEKEEVEKNVPVRQN